MPDRMHEDDDIARCYDGCYQDRASQDAAFWSIFLVFVIAVGIWVGAYYAATWFWSVIQ